MDTESLQTSSDKKELETLRYIVNMLRDALNNGATITRTVSESPVLQIYHDSLTIKGNITLDYSKEKSVN